MGGCDHEMALELETATWRASSANNGHSPYPKNYGHTLLLWVPFILQLSPSNFAILQLYPSFVIINCMVGER